jgi:hypothetical protein
MTIPARSIACHLVNVFGGKMRLRPRHRTGSFYRLPPNWVAEMVAAGLCCQRVLPARLPQEAYRSQAAKLARLDHSQARAIPRDR